METKAKRINPLVLIVDDDITMRILMRESLVQDGFDVQEAESGKEALSLFDRLKPDIILLDVQMPEMDGFTVCAELRRRPGGALTPVLLVTGLDDVESIRHAYEVGATDFVTKPINWMILSHRVRYMLRSSESVMALRKSETLLTNAQRIACLGHWEWNIKINNMHLSDEACRIIDIMPDDFDRSYDAFIQAIHPDERQTVKTYIFEAIFLDKPFSIEHRIVMQDGRERTVYQQAKVFYGSDGEALGMVGTIQDITDRKNREMELRKSKDFNETVLNSINDAIAIIDTDNFRILGMNDNLQKELGLSKKEILGETCYKLTHHRSDPCTPPDDTCPLLETVVTGNNAVAEHIHYIQHNEKRYIEITTSPIKDEHGNVIQVVHVSRDITQRKKAEEALKSYATKLEWSNRELQNIFTVTSHDLQEPLRKVQTFSSRLMAKYKDTLDDEGYKYLERTQQEAKRTQVLINDILTYSRVTTRAQPFSPVDLTAAVRHVVSELNDRIDEKQGRVEFSNLPVIESDPQQIHQVFHQLIDNALKFSHKLRPPVIKIYGRFLNADGECLNGGSVNHAFFELTVEDNGIGFDEKYNDRIFKVFQRLHGDKEYKGTGIGLPVCRKIVERHAGDIAAKSNPDQGSRFIITLPVKQSSAPSRPIPVS